MPMVTPSLNLPQPALSSATAPKAAAPAPALPTAPPTPPSATVTLSPQAMSALSSSSHPSSSTPAASTPAAAPAPAAHDGSVYESLKSGISTAVSDVGDAIASGAHAVVDGVETTLSSANKVATGILELPFAAVSKACDAVGGLIDEF